jgi:hypothetical protein
MVEVYSEDKEKNYGLNVLPKVHMLETWFFMQVCWEVGPLGGGLPFWVD